MIELFIDGNRADISQDISTLLTFTIDDIKDFSGRNTSFSKTIVMPGTNRNNALFGSIFDFNVYNNQTGTLPNVGNNFNASKGVPALIFQSNIQVFKGTLRLMEIQIDKKTIEYEVCVFGELGGLVSAIGNKKIDELNFSAYDHTYSIANITGSWNNASNGSGYYYPLMDYGQASTNKHDWSYRTFRPAIFVKEVLDKVFAAANFTYNCSLFNTTRFKSLINPCTNMYLGKKVGYLFDANIIGTTTSPLQYCAQFSGVSYTSGSITPNGTNTFFKYISPTTLDVNFSGRVNGTVNLSSSYFYDIYIGVFNEIPSQPGKFQLASGQHIHNHLSAFDVNFNFNASLATNQYIGILCTSNVTFAGTSIRATPNGSTLLELNLGESIVMNEHLPKGIFQKDYLSSILKLFNLYIYDDPHKENFVNITPYVDFYDTNPANAKDWTYKIDRSKLISLKPMSELNARYYEFNYKSDSDYYNEMYKNRYNLTYGSYLFDSNYEFSKESEKVDIIFSGTPLVGYSGEDKIYSTAFKKTNSGEDRMDTNIRILQAKKITGVSSWNILDSNMTTVLNTGTAYGYAGHFNDPDAPANDINFGVPRELFFTLVTGAININQFNVYWSPYMAEITDKDSKLLTATIYLKTRDVIELDFSKFIWIDGALWRLNKIEDFNATNDDTCKITLLKVINTQY